MIEHDEENIQWFFEIELKYWTIKRNSLNWNKECFSDKTATLLMLLSKNIYHHPKNVENSFEILLTTFPFLRIAKFSEIGFNWNSVETLSTNNKVLWFLIGNNVQQSR